MPIHVVITRRVKIGREGEFQAALLDFFQLLVLPFTILGSWLDYVGIPSSISWYLGLLFTPVSYTHLTLPTILRV